MLEYNLELLMSVGIAYVVIFEGSQKPKAPQINCTTSHKCQAFDVAEISRGYQDVTRDFPTSLCIPKGKASSTWPYKSPRQLPKTQCMGQSDGTAVSSYNAHKMAPCAFQTPPLEFHPKAPT